MFFAVEVFSVILAKGLSAPHDSILVVAPPPPPPPPPPPAPPGTLHGLLRLPAREAFKSLNETGHFHPSVPRRPRAATRAGLNGARPGPAFHFANMLYLTGTVRVQTLSTLAGVAWRVCVCAFWQVCWSRFLQQGVGECSRGKFQRALRLSGVWPA